MQGSIIIPPENIKLRFFWYFRGYPKRTVAWNGLMDLIKIKLAASYYRINRSNNSLGSGLYRIRVQDNLEKTKTKQKQEKTKH